MPDTPARAGGRQASPLAWRHVKTIEVATLALMSVASLASAWSGYQSTRWGTVQARSGSEANALRVRANRAAGEAGAQKMADAQMFTRWLEADARQDRQTEQFYRRHFRAEFKPAFQDWEAARARGDPLGRDTPLASPAYRIAAAEHADDLDRRAEQAASNARAADARAEAYVMNTLVFALVLFLTGMAQSFQHPRLRLVLLGMAGAVCLYGLYGLAISPVR